MYVHLTVIIWRKEELEEEEEEEEREGGMEGRVLIEGWSRSGVRRKEERYTRQKRQRSVHIVVCGVCREREMEEEKEEEAAVFKKKRERESKKKIAKKNKRLEE